MDVLEKIIDIDETQQKRLIENGIKCLKDFINHDTRSLARILVRDFETVKYLKSITKTVNRSPCWTTLEDLSNFFNNVVNYSTGIQSVDEILPTKGIFSGGIVEITGPYGAGKSMLVYSIMINLLEENEELEILFIDTRFKFSAVNFKNILIHRNIPEAKQIQMMKRVMLEKCRRAEDVIKLLKYYYGTPKQHENLKFIVIDSITVP